MCVCVYPVIADVVSVAGLNICNSHKNYNKTVFTVQRPKRSELNDVCAESSIISTHKFYFRF